MPDFFLLILVNNNLKNSLKKTIISAIRLWVKTLS